MIENNLNDRGASGGGNWQPLLTVGRDACVRLGVSPKGDWLIEMPSGLQPLDERNIITLLPLLEKLKTTIEGELRFSSAAKGIAFEKLPLLPIEDLLLLALRSPSEYWQSLALEWVPLPLEGRMKAAVEALEKLGASQRLRHAAKRLLKSQR